MNKIISSFEKEQKSSNNYDIFVKFNFYFLIVLLIILCYKYEHGDFNDLVL